MSTSIRAFATKATIRRLTSVIPLDTKLGQWKPVSRHRDYTQFRTSTHAFIRNGHEFLQYKIGSTGIYFKADGIAPTILTESHTITACFDDERLWTTLPFNCIEILLNPKPMTISSTSPLIFSNQGGADGSVGIMTGNSTSAFEIHHNGMKHSGSYRSEVITDVTPYRKELEGIKGTQDRANEIELTVLRHTCDNQSAVDNANTPYRNPSQMLNAEADIILAIHHQRERGTKFHL